MPKKLIGGTCSVAWVPPLIAGTWMITKSTRYCIARVEIARYRPLTRNAAAPNSTPMAALKKPAASSTSSNGSPARARCTEP